METYLLPMHREDYSIQQKLAAKYEITLLPLPVCWEEMQLFVGGLDLVVSTRLHGLVAAVIQGIPCFGLAVTENRRILCAIGGYTT